MSPDGFRRLCRARDLLCELRDEPVTIRQAAREAGASPYQFIRQFAAMFGTTPHQFRIEQRIGRAKTLLASGDLSVTEVCMELGFSSLGSFSTLFATRVGQSPSTFRRRIFPVGASPEDRIVNLAPCCLTLMWRLPPDTAIFEKH